MIHLLQQQALNSPTKLDKRGERDWDNEISTLELPSFQTHIWKCSGTLDYIAEGDLVERCELRHASVNAEDV